MMNKKQKKKMEGIIRENLSNPEFILKHASMRLVPASRKNTLQKGDIFKEFGPDMLIQCGLEVECPGEGVFWLTMNTATLFSLPGEPEEKLCAFHEAVVKNLKKDTVVFPMGITPIEMLAGMKDHTQRMDFGTGCFPVIVTNRSRINGAATVLAIAELAEEKLGAFYVAPSSLHEVILFPERMGINYEDVARMVKEVNCSEVAEKDFLSNTVCRYENSNFFIPKHKEQA